MLAAPYGDLLKLICRELKLLPPDQFSSGLTPDTT